MKSFKRMASCVLGVAMAISCMAPVTALAAEDFRQPTDNINIGPHNNSDVMLHTTQVFRIGKHSFFTVNANKTVSYFDQDATGRTAIPAGYIQSSPYNATGEEYGVYLTGTYDANAENFGYKMHYVKIADCEQKADNTVWWNHGTADEAKVSDDSRDDDHNGVKDYADTATNEDPSMSTQFYLYLDNDTEIPPETPPVEEVHDAVHTPDGRVDYDITVATVDHVNMKATVPLYVCMYGFRSTGNVVTPTSDAYRLRNYSTIEKNSRTYIADITKVTHYARIYDSDHSTDELFSIAYDEGTKQYTYWYSDPQLELGWVRPTIYKEIADQHINASGECYVIYIDNAWSFKAAGQLDGDALRETVQGIDPNHELAKDFKIVDGATECNFGKIFNVGLSLTDNAKREGLAIKTTQIQAQPATWRLVPMSTKNLKRGEIAMSIAPVKALYNASAVDLSTCTAPLDITENGWFLAGPTNVKTIAEVGDGFFAADYEGTNGADANGNLANLPLIVKAKIAGGNVNDVGCTPVVRVTYSIIPMFETGDPQTATDTGVASNRVNY